MRGPFLTRTSSAGLSLGAALILASCAAPPTAPPRAPAASRRRHSIDGATVEFASFQNSAFPYHGLIPNYQETGKTRPFLDVDDNGRLGHSSPRGGLLWEDQTYNDRTVLLAAPQGFDPAEPGVIVVFFHGNNATLQRDVVARQQIVRQLADSGLNGVLVAPQLALDAPDSSAGRFWSPGGFAAFLNEAEAKLGEFYPAARGAFRRMPVVIVAYSGGYLPAVYSLTVGGEGGRVRGVVLLDALYGETRQVRALGRGLRAAAPSSSAPIRPPRATAIWRSRPSFSRRGSPCRTNCRRGSRPARSPSSTRARSTTTTSSPPPGAARRCGTSFRACGSRRNPGPGVRPSRRPDVRTRRRATTGVDV